MIIILFTPTIMHGLKEFRSVKPAEKLRLQLKSWNYGHNKMSIKISKILKKFFLISVQK